MKVLHYIPSIDQNYGGVSSYLRILAYSLGKIAELHVITHRSENELKIENCKIHYIENGLGKLIKARLQFRTLIEAIKPDIVHVNSCWEPLCSLTVFWAKHLGYPVVITPHGMLEPWVIAKNHWKKKIPALLLYQRKSLRMANALIATAESEKKNLQKLGYNSKVEVVPNGIIVDGIDIKKTWKRTYNVLYMGLLRPNKGAGMLLDALSLIQDKLDGYKVIIAGPDTEGYLEVLKEKCAKYGLEDLVEFPGGVFGSEKWNLMQQADVFVLPTLNENFGLVIAESYLSGTPVITCKGAPWACIEKNKFGWWEERTPENIAKAMLEAVAVSEESLEDMGKRGRNYVINNFASEKIAAVIMQKYQDIIADCRLDD